MQTYCGCRLCQEGLVMISDNIGLPTLQSRSQLPAHQNMHLHLLCENGVHADQPTVPCNDALREVSIACEHHLACSKRCFSDIRESSLCRSASISRRHLCTSLSSICISLLTTITRALRRSCLLRRSSAALISVTGFIKAELSMPSHQHPFWPLCCQQYVRGDKIGTYP